MANYNVDIDVAVRGYNRVERTLKRLDRLIGPPRVLEINPGIQFRKFRQQKLQLLKEMRRAGVEAAVAYQEAFEREARIARQIAGAGSRTLPAAAGPIALLPATAIGQFQRAANLAAKIDLAFARAKGSVNEMATTLGGARFAGTSKPPLMLPPAAAPLALPPAFLPGGIGGTGGAGKGFGSFAAPSPAFNPNMYASPIGPMAAPGFTVASGMQGAGKRFGGAVAAGAFPLLFGGGLGQAAGGFLGGLGSGKMFSGLTVALQVLGGSLDKLAADTQAVALASRNAGTALQLMTERNLFSTKEIQNRAEKLLELGKAEELAALLTDELVTKIGSEGFDALQDLGDETDRVNKLWNELTIQLQALIAGPLSDFLSLIGDLLQEQVQFNRLNALRKDLAGTAAGEELEQKIATIQGKGAKLELLGGQEVEDYFFDTRMSTALTGDLAQELFEEFEPNRKKPTRKMGLEISPRTGKTDAERLAEKTQKDKQAVADALKAAQQKLAVMEQESALAKKLKELDFERAKKIQEINEKEFAGTEARQEAIKATNELFDAKKGEAIGKALAQDLQTAIELKKAQQDVLRPLEDQKRLLEAKLNGNEKEVRLQLEIEDIMRSVEGLNRQDVENLVRKKAELEEQVSLVEQLDDIYASIGQSISSGIVDALTAAVDETKSLADVASQTLRQIANILLQFGVQTALSSLGGNDTVGFFTKLFPKKALGGAVGANQPYMVGEKGPELFVPGAQGNIVPNNAMGGSNIVVNVDASGSSVEGNGQQSKALGQAIGAAVQAEIVKQKMPGGLLN